MKTKTKSLPCVVHSIAAAVLLLTAQISLASSATWLLSPQDSAWENANNWTVGGPPNGPSDTATFAHSSQTSVGISTSVEVNSILFSSGSPSFDFSMSSSGALIISGTGVINNNSILQNFGNNGQLIFNNIATAASAGIDNYAEDPQTGSAAGYTIFNDRSSAAGASIFNFGSFGPLMGGQAPGATIFKGTSTAGHATITNSGANFHGGSGASTTFNDSSTADNAILVADEGFSASDAAAIVFNGASSAGSAILIANGGDPYFSEGGAIVFNGASTGGTARVEIFDNGYLDISRRQPGMTIGSIEGSGNVYLGANRLTVGTNGINTSFSGLISGSGLLAKTGSGILTLQANNCIADTVGIILVSGSVIKLDFTGPPDVIASLKVNGVPQPPGIYGGSMSGAPNILLEFRGSGTVSIGPVSTLGNISTRAFVQTGDNVVIGGFIVQRTEPKRVIIRAIGPELTQYGVPNALANPTLELHEGTGALIASNDNWHNTIIGGIIRSDQSGDIRNSGYAPGDGRESAIIAELPAGNYTAIVRGVNNTMGIALVEVYDLSPETNSILSNISTRSFVQTGDNVMIGGFIVQGTQSKRVVVRDIGPELGAPPYNIPDALANPTLELHNGTGHLIASNDNWRTTITGGIITSDQVQQIRSSGYAPGDARESAIIADLPPGNYTAIMRGVNNTTGVGLVEVYDLDQ